MNTDINLAGLGVISFLVLFFPVVGLIHRRRYRLAEHRAVQKLIHEEATRIVAETEAQYQRGAWRP